MTLEFAQSTPTASSIAALVQARYDLGQVIDSEFLRRSFNQVYRIGFDNGRRVVARLCAERPRGGPNAVFEAAALAHWAQAGCAVSRCLPTSNGQVSVQVALPEGTRELILFEHLDGEFTSDAPDDIAAFAHGLAALHLAGETYHGPDSAYELDLDHLLLKPLQNLLRASTMTADLRPQFEALGRTMHDDILAMGELTRVLCHGDAHGGNNFIVRNAQGGRDAVFFDFDEAGPGYLAYELAVYPWALFPRAADGVLGDKPKAQWLAFISAYREKVTVAEADLAAIARFMAVRQIWLLGEHAARASIWGSQSIPTDYLRRQVAMLRHWESVQLPM